MSATELLIEDLSELGVSEGDTLLIHSSLIHFDYQRFGGIEQMAEELFNALIEILGEDGTLVVPTFTLNWVENHPDGTFVLEESKSEMGVFTELVRTKEESVRTLHPHTSFAIYGANSQELGRIHDPDTFGRKYIFAKLHDVNAQIMSFGLPYNDSFTYFHYIEQQKDVKYRHKKWFSGTIEVGGKSFSGRYSLYTRDLSENVQTNVDPMGEKLEEQGVISSRSILGGEVKLGKAKPIFDTVYDLLTQNEHLMYTDDG